jgi:dihydroorotase
VHDEAKGWDMQVDVRIRNGRVHTPSGPIDADLLVKGERIVGMVDRNDGTAGATEIDAADKDILPGLVETHAHTRTPGLEYKEDFLTISQAAAAGGITTLVDMPNVEPPTTTVERFERARHIAARDCIVDWGHFVAGVELDQIPALAARGATGFKIFQVSGHYPHDPRLAMDAPDRLYAAFHAIATTGLPLLIHPFNQPLMDLLSERAIASGKPRDYTTFSEVYTTELVWSSAVPLLLEYQRVTGVRLHLLHTHAARSLQLIRRAKAEGQRISASVDLKYFHMTHRDLEEQGPRAMPGGFVTENAERMRLIWQSLADGTLDVIDSDHAPHTLDDLELMRKDAWTGPWGSPQYDYMLSVILTDVSKGKLTLETAIRALCENPARLIGYYPRKGALQVGSDADLVIVDLNREVVASDETTYTKVKWTPYRGWRLKGVPVLTMRRGTVIARDGKVVGRPGSGRYLPGVPQEPVPIEGYRSPGLAFRPLVRVAHPV